MKTLTVGMFASLTAVGWAGTVALLAPPAQTPQGLLEEGYRRYSASDAAWFLANTHPNEIKLLDLDLAKVQALMTYAKERTGAATLRKPIFSTWNDERQAIGDAFYDGGPPGLDLPLTAIATPNGPRLFVSHPFVVVGAYARYGDLPKVPSCSRWFLAMREAIRKERNALDALGIPGIHDLQPEGKILSWEKLVSMADRVESRIGTER
jgi:hypothetical protein